MNRRPQDVVSYKTGGKQKDFAILCGWTPQYLAKPLRGENLGIKPVVTLLEALPEITARWLLLGRGGMLEVGQRLNLQRVAFSHIQAILEMERYTPCMLPNELHGYEQAVTAGREPILSTGTLLSWIRQEKSAGTS